MIIKLLIFFIIQHASSQKFHEEFSAEERSELFPTATDSELPEYEIVPIYHSRIQKRDARGKNINFEAFNQTINLWLNPLDGILATSHTPVYTLEDSFLIMPLDNAMENITNKLYEDERQNTTVTLSEGPDGDFNLNGRIGSLNASIRPVSKKFIESRERKRISLDNITSQNGKTFTYHIIQKIPEQSKFLKTSNFSWSNSIRSKRSTLKPLYPEILVIIDYPLFEIMNKNYYDALVYILTFFNGVDLKYRAITNPKIRLNIAAIFIATKKNALEYMKNYTPYYPNDLIVDEALESKSEWINTLKTGDFFWGINIDIAVTLSSDVFCIMVKEEECIRGSKGVSYLEGACTDPVAIIHDTFGFEGILYTAHEIGHLIGMDHDGEENNFRCDMRKGYIMSSAISATKLASEWSLCSLEQLENFLKNKESSCLTNKPTDGLKVPRILPGKLKDVHEQCRRIFGTDALKIDETICRKISCKYPRNSGKWITEIAAADGTSCGVEKICLHQQCVEESVIKNYTKSLSEKS